MGQLRSKKKSYLTKPKIKFFRHISKVHPVWSRFKLRTPAADFSKPSSSIIPVSSFSLGSWQFTKKDWILYQTIIHKPNNVILNFILSFNWGRTCHCFQNSFIYFFPQLSTCYKARSISNTRFMSQNKQEMGSHGTRKTSSAK